MRGGKRAGSGAPQTIGPGARTALNVRCTRDDLARWRLAAEAADISVAEVARDALNAWAEKVLDRTDRTTLAAVFGREKP